MGNGQNTNMKAIPHHVAIIMDGNGRWAGSRGLPRTEGHRRGVEAAKRSVEAARDLGVKYLTLFGFSSENWARPESEVTELMRLLRLYLRSETAEMHRNKVRLRVIGDRERLPSDILDLIENAEQLTQAHTNHHLTIALSYGGRQDILHAVQQIAKKALAGQIDPDAVTIQDFGGFLATQDLPDPDLLIRTSGEQRISNFLLWQSAYTELFFTDTLWPDFDKSDMEAAISEYLKRDRRYGKTASSS